MRTGGRGPCGVPRPSWRQGRYARSVGRGLSLPYSLAQLGKTVVVIRGTLRLEPRGLAVRQDLEHECAGVLTIGLAGAIVCVHRFRRPLRAGANWWPGCLRGGPATDGFGSI